MAEEQTQPNSKKAPIVAAVICLVCAWIMALAPIPVISTLTMTAFNIAAFILAILCMSRQRVMPGAGILVGCVVGTPILYFASYPLLLALGLTLGGSASHGEAAVQPAVPAHQVANIPEVRDQKAAPVPPSAPSNTPPAPTGDADRSLSQSKTPVTAAQINGLWSGSYVCGQGATGLALTLNTENARDVSGIFKFYSMPGSANAPSGSFNMSGTIKNGVLLLNGTSWIEQPPGYGMVKLRGNLTANSPNVIRGAILTPGCSTFVVDRK